MKKILCSIVPLQIVISVIEMSKMEVFIVGGGFVSMEQVPHAALLSIDCKTTDMQTRGFSCGATILNQHILISAAHCFEECIPEQSKVFVTVGSETRNKLSTYTAQKYVMHQKYARNILTNDISLILLPKPIKLSTRVKRVVILKNLSNATKGFVTGWGRVDEETAGGSKNIKGANQLIISNYDCLLKTQMKFLPEGTFCAQGVETDSDFGFAAHGDSGSGLIVDDYILAGIVSFKSHIHNTHVVVYTDVAYHINWIQNTTQDLHCEINNDYK